MWTKDHFNLIVPAFIVLIALAIFLAWLLRGKSEKARRLPFQIMAIVLLIFEGMKQGYNMQGGEYNEYALPFHFCSLFLYTYPLHAFYTGKHKKTANTIAFCCGASLFLFMLVMPAVVFSDGNIQQYFKSFDSFHTVTFHLYVCFYFFLMVAMKEFEMDTKRDVKVISIFYGGYAVVATAMSYIFDENFHNLLRSNLAAAESVRLAIVENIGWVGQALYTLIMWVLTVAFALIAYFAVKGLLMLISKIAKKLKKEQV